MPSRIVFLGTAGSISVVSKKARSSGGIIIQSEDFQLHLDPGPGALTNAAQTGINVRAHTAILASHAHLNHTNDLNALISAMTLNGLDNHGILIAPESVVQGNQQNKPVLQDYFAKQLEKIIIAHPNKKLAVGNIEVHTLPAQHHEPNAVGYKLFTPEFILVYSGDTDYTTELAKAYTGADILILNCPNPGKSKERGLCSADVIKILKKVQPKLCVLTHFSQKMIDANPLYEVREIKKQTGVQVVAAEDGMTIDPLSYNAELKQKTLNVFKQQNQENNQQGSQ
jgi:ribonuclease BN (tRNA processing enzyme)